MKVIVTAIGSYTHGRLGTKLNHPDIRKILGYLGEVTIHVNAVRILSALFPVHKLA